MYIIISGYTGGNWYKSMQTVTDNLTNIRSALSNISVDVSLSNKKSISLRYVTDILTSSERKYYKKYIVLIVHEINIRVQYILNP